MSAFVFHKANKTDDVWVYRSDTEEAEVRWHMSSNFSMVMTFISASDAVKNLIKNAKFKNIDNDCLSLTAVIDIQMEGEKEMVELEIQPMTIKPRNYDAEELQEEQDLREQNLEDTVIFLRNEVENLKEQVRLLHMKVPLPKWGDF